MKKVITKVICWLWTRGNPYDESKWVNKLHYKMCPDYDLGPDYKFGGK